MLLCGWERNASKESSAVMLHQVSVSSSIAVYHVKKNNKNYAILESLSVLFLKVYTNNRELQYRKSNYSSPALTIFFLIV